MMEDLDFSELANSGTEFRETDHDKWRKPCRSKLYIKNGPNSIKIIKEIWKSKHSSKDWSTTNKTFDIKSNYKNLLKWTWEARTWSRSRMNEGENKEAQSLTITPRQGTIRLRTQSSIILRTPIFSRRFKTKLTNYHDKILYFFTKANYDWLSEVRLIIIFIQQWRNYRSIIRQRRLKRESRKRIRRYRKSRECKLRGSRE